MKSDAAEEEKKKKSTQPRHPVAGRVRVSRPYSASLGKGFPAKGGQSL